MQTTLHIVKGGFIRRDQTCFRTHFDGHIAQRHTTFHAQIANGFTAELHHVAGAAGATGFANNGQHDIFSGDARRCFAIHFNLHGPGTALLQGLSRQDVLNFGGADTKRQRAKCAVSGGVGIAADDGHPRQGHALFRPHHVDDTLIRVVQIVQLNAELLAVFDQLLHLNARHFAGRVDIFRLGRNVMVHGGEGFTRLTNLTVVRAQAVKGLW